MAVHDAVRPGLAGHWDRFVGPGATTAENIGSLGFGAAGMLLAPTVAATRRWLVTRTTLRALGADLWGGAWCNNTPTCIRWYERDVQGLGEHLTFAALHLHPFVIGWLDRGTRRTPWWLWGAAHYGYLVAATVITVRSTDGGRRRTAGVLTTAGGVLLDRVLRRSAATPWFAPVFYVKLLCGHAAGGALTPRPRWTTQHRATG